MINADPFEVMFYAHEMSWLDQFPDYDKMTPTHHKWGRNLRQAMHQAKLNAETLSSLTFSTEGHTLSYKWVLMAMVGLQSHNFEENAKRLAPLLDCTVEELLKV